MIDAFHALGLPPQLDLTDEELREAFRAAGKKSHPDVGGSEAEFAALNEAFAILSSPSRRLRHWLELQDLTIVSRGSIDSSIMDLFTEVGAATQQAEAAIRKREDAKSALVRAMSEPEIQTARDVIEASNQKVERRISQQCENFPVFENTLTLDSEHASQVMRNLVFLEKWRASLRAYFSRLV